MSKDKSETAAQSLTGEDASLSGSSFIEPIPDITVSGIAMNILGASVHGLGRVVRGIGSRATSMIATIVEHDYADSSTPLKIERQGDKDV